jgi:hypothetical protein
MRLYKAQDVTPECAADEYEDEDGIFDAIAWDERKSPTTEAEGAPAGWDQHCLDVWGEPHEFFIPSDRRIYRSRSSAQERVDLINRWGGHAVLVEADVDWVPVTEANRRRKRARLKAKAQRLIGQAQAVADQLAALDGEAL